jgi:prophage maintenance system killer protein
MPVARFNIPEIRRSLEQTQSLFDGIDRSLNACRGSMTNEAVANMVEGYRFVDELLARDTDLFAMGNSALLLEINALVLCGVDEVERASFNRHIKQTERKFYEDEQGGIGSLMEWYKFHQHDDIWRRVAGLYIQIISQPQLFIEGNHRSAVLIVSFMLGREGHPPFVLTPDNAKELLDQSRSIGGLKRHGFSTLIQTPRLCNLLAATLRSHLEERHSLEA